jgi:hypothetical protein
MIRRAFVEGGTLRVTTRTRRTPSIMMCSDWGIYGEESMMVEQS